MLQAKQSGCDRVLLTQQLRRYSADHVKITKEDTEQAKRLVDNYIKKEILPCICSESSLPISKQEYTGSLYEKLKTEAADEVDVMVILQTTKQEVTQEDVGVPGFVLLKASQDSQLRKYANAAGYILPEKLRASWFFGLVHKAVNQLQGKDPALSVKLEVRAHGPAVQLDITDKETEKKLSADLVPSFQLSATEYFVAKSYTGKISPACDSKLLWRQSFSLREKARLQDMDKEDHGCRHELLRIIKTLIRAETTFAKLSSYHLKTVFLHYNSNPKLKWGVDMLGERFLEYTEMLYTALSKKTLDNFWVEGVNLLDNIQDKTLENMADRLRKILDNDKERSKVLKCEMQLDSDGRKARENCPAITSGQQKQVLPNTCQTSTDLLQLLRKFLNKLEAILSDEIKWSKEVIEEYMKNGVLKYCQDNSPMIISKFDYGGSLYENLKTARPNEDDVVIHVVLKAKKGFVTINVENPGYATIKAVEGSPYKEYSREDGLLMPKKFKSWLIKLVNSAVQELSFKEASSMSLKASSCSTGVKVIISQSKTQTLEVKLVPTFPLSSDEYFVPPSQQGNLPAGTDCETAWVKSYTLMQKSLLKDMDKDQGCRHDLFKITNTVLRREPTFSPLSSFHVKTALLWYNQTTTEWNREQLAERFTGFVGFLRDALKRKDLKHFWITDLNLLADISAVTLGNMESRLTKILNSEQERSKVLKAEQQKGKKQDAKNVATGTHTRGARSKMSDDTFIGEHPEKPSNRVSHSERKSCRNIEESKTGYMDMQIRKLPYGIIKKLSDQLDIDGPRDWRALISVMPIGMISQEQVWLFEMQRARTVGSPSMALLTELGQSTKTVRRLVMWLKKIRNCQALDILEYKEEVQIIKQPKSQPVRVGGTVTLRCEATGYPAPRYQWVKDGAELPDGVNEELTLDTVTMCDSGNYFCLVSNHVNAEKSDAVDLEVLPSPGVIKEDSIEGIFTSEGGVMPGGNIRLVCPPGALDDSLSVTITLEDPSKYYSLIVQKDLENDVIIAAPIVNLQPNGHSFRKPMKLTTSFKHMKWKWNGDDVFILHGTESRDGKVTWQDITKSSKINEAAGEVEVELKHFSLIMVLLRWTLIRSKDILSRFDLLSFDYTLLVLLNKTSPSSAHDMLALLFVSQDVYHEQFFREDETSALVQLKKEGFIEVHEHATDRLDKKRIYNHENLQVTIQLGEDYRLSDSQHRSFCFSVDSFVWWNGGKVIKLPLEWRNEVRYLCGTVSVNGENGHASKKHFSEGDLCNYVRKLLGMEGNIFNVVTIARLLEMPEELMHQVTSSWEDDCEQLNLSLQHWSEKSAEVENLSSLRKCLEGINEEEYNVTSRGQMHIRRLRKLATKITDLQPVNTDLVRYFSSKATILCNSVLRDCCLELNQDKAFSSSNNADPLVKQFIENRQPMPEDISTKYKLVCSPSDESRTSIFLAIVPHLIQTIKEIFVDHKRLVPHSGLIGLHEDKVNQLLTSVLNARQNNRFRDLVYVECQILEKLCLKNRSKKPVAEITKWSESLAIEQMLNFLERFFKHCLHDIRLHRRLEIFSCRLRDTLLTDDKEVDEDYMQDFANILLSLIDFAKFDPSKLVRFELIDSKNSTLSSTSSDVENVVHDEYDDTYSQTFSIKKVSEDELQLNAAACVRIYGSMRKIGAFQSVIMLNQSGMDAFNICMSRFAPADIAVMKMEAENKHLGNLRTVLFTSQKEKLSELIQIFKRELSKDMVDLSHSEVSQCYLSMRCIDFTKEKVLRLRLVYKWGSEAVALDSNDFVTFSDCSTGGACLPEVKSFGLDNSLMSEDLEALSLTAVGGKFPSTSFDELQKHGSAQCGKIEYHLHQTFNQVTSPQTCVIGNQATVNDQTPSQRALPEGLNYSPKRSITEGRKSLPEADHELENTSHARPCSYDQQSS